VAGAKKKARRLRAHLIFLDESGFLMAPLLRRSWAPRGSTPVIRQRTANHQKVSAIAALSVCPARRRVGLWFRLYPGCDIRWPQVLGFVRGLLRQRRGRVILILDRLNAHRSAKRRLEQVRRLDVVFLPPYAPELNPVENVWSHLKMNPLANLPIHELEELRATAHRHGRRLQRRLRLLRSFIQHTPLSLRLK
jgi:putative transposase